MLIPQEMRVKVTTEIDGGLRLMYESIQDKDKPTLRQIIERGMVEYLCEKDPIAMLKTQIEIDERNLQERREKLAEMHILEPQPKRILEYESKEDEQQKNLEVWFRSDIERIIDGVERGWLNYRKIAPRFGMSVTKIEESIRNLVTKWKLEHQKI